MTLIHITIIIILLLLIFRLFMSLAKYDNEGIIDAIKKIAAIVDERHAATQLRLAQLEEKLDDIYYIEEEV